MTDRLHRHARANPPLWNAIRGAVRAAMNAHPDIQIPERRMASIVKRCVGQMLALGAGSARADDSAGGGNCLTVARDAAWSEDPQRGGGERQAAPDNTAEELAAPWVELAETFRVWGKVMAEMMAEAQDTEEGKHT